ncbi:unnamed protein product [Caenorhabditis angaria]|uniref:Peptidase M12B domain-containing protein n=1 Tax=Caenorhabditis angaria TaxID=860376 RepID=A0A9P1J243_9PELO|nr:unnamed protein product [Caenorhabditis angaria]
MRHVLLIILAYIIYPSTENHFNSRVNKYGKVSFYNSRSNFIQFHCMGVEYSINIEPNNDIIHPDLDLKHSEYKGIIREPVYGIATLSKIGTSYVGALSFLNDTIYLEHSSIHELAEDSEVICYSASDTKHDIYPHNTPSIDYVLPILGFSYPKANPFKKYLPRKKRQIRNSQIANIEKNRCTLKIVADYAFYSKFMKNSSVDVTRYLVNMIARTNEIFTRVDWDEDSDDIGETRLVNLGFSIKEIKIQYSENETETHYNSFADKSRPPSSILENFAKFEGSSDFCLVHLVSGRTFMSDVLGLAYVATVYRDPGGICSETAKIGNQNTPMNVAMTSVYKGSIDSSYPLTTKEIDIVVAHEYGHSWGANHDPANLNTDEDTKNCAPDLESGGSYLMHPTAQTGHYPNNVFFSPCSKNNIRKILKKKAQTCFEKGISKLCGNGIIDEGEQCDNGVYNQESKCCDKNCLLHENAQCSPVNHGCCTDFCMFHNSSHVCRESDPKFCEKEAFCDGVSGDCPRGPPIENGKECFDFGKCRDGVCLSYCETLGKKSCICREPELSCRRCCVGANGNCIPEFGSMYLQDGTACIHGVCRKNRCVYQQIDHVRNYFATSFENGMKFGKLVKSNLVIIVVFIVTICYGGIVFVFTMREKYIEGVIEKKKTF